MTGFNDRAKVPDNHGLALHSISPKVGSPIWPKARIGYEDVNLNMFPKYDDTWNDITVTVYILNNRQLIDLFHSVSVS